MVLKKKINHDKSTLPQDLLQLVFEHQCPSRSSGSDSPGQSGLAPDELVLANKFDPKPSAGALPTFSGLGWSDPAGADKN